MKSLSHEYFSHIMGYPQSPKEKRTMFWLIVPNFIYFLLVTNKVPSCSLLIDVSVGP